MDAAKLEDLLAKFGREHWVPVLEAHDGQRLGSHYASPPWLGSDEPWPVCGTCETPLDPFVQLDLAQLPAELAWPVSSGLVQLFHCTSTDCDVTAAASWEPFSTASLARWVPADRIAAVAVSSEPPPAVTTESLRMRGPAPMRVVGWRAGGRELPAYADSEFGGRADEVFAELPDEAWDEMQEAGIAAHAGPKLGGWPRWIQGPEYPSCQKCGDSMRVLLQVDSDDPAGYQFGDVGTGHISQCPRHPEVVAFGWACH